MIKLTFCLTRLSHLSLADFQTYWRQTHAPLVAKHAETLGIVRYVQTHADEHPFNAALIESRGGPEGYDGVAELWFRSYEDILENADDPARVAAGAELLEDERKFIDLTRSPLWMNGEHVIVG